ncbi:MAG: S-adenosylmethionine decarboxylase [Bryobacteraceae bacterium]
MIPSGCEWIVEAHGCDPESLADPGKLQAMFERLCQALDLHPVGDPLWHQFPVTGGMTGMTLLSESHIACHTFPEYGSLCLNVFCCRPRPEWDFAEYFKSSFGADSVQVRRLDRPYARNESKEELVGAGHGQAGLKIARETTE